MTLVNHFILILRAFTINVPKLPNCSIFSLVMIQIFVIFIVVECLFKFEHFMNN